MICVRDRWGHLFGTSAMAYALYLNYGNLFLRCGHDHKGFAMTHFICVSTHEMRIYGHHGILLGAYHPQNCSHGCYSSDNSNRLA